MLNKEKRKECVKKYNASAKAKESRKRYQKSITGRQWSKQWREKQKLRAFEILGAKCSNPDCLIPGGCTDIRCLQIDHINGGGSKERKRFHIPLQVFKNPSAYQVLCANCNWIKRVEKHEIKNIVH